MSEDTTEVLNAQSPEIIEIVTTNANKNDNDILGLLVQAGIPFGDSRKILKKVFEEQGLRLTKDQKEEKVKEVMSRFEVTEETTVEEVSEQIELVAAECEISNAMAKKHVKLAFTEADITMPSVPKTGGGTRGPREPGFRGDVKIAADYAMANPEAVENDKEEFKNYMDSVGKSTTKSGKDKAGNWYNAVVELRMFGKEWQEKHC